MTHGCVPMKGDSFRVARFQPAVAQFLLVPGMAVLTACTTGSLACSGDRAAAMPYGSLILSGPTFGTEALLPTACVSGERELFLGVDLREVHTGGGVQRQPRCEESGDGGSHRDSV